MTVTLNNHATPLWVTTQYKWWYIPEVEAKPKEYRKIKRLYQQGRTNTFTLKVIGNTYYYTIRRAKIHYWTGVIQEADETLVESERF